METRRKKEREEGKRTNASPLTKVVAQIKGTIVETSILKIDHIDGVYLVFVNECQSMNKKTKRKRKKSEKEKDEPSWRMMFSELRSLWQKTTGRSWLSTNLWISSA